MPYFEVVTFPTFGSNEEPGAGKHVMVPRREFHATRIGHGYYVLDHHGEYRAARDADLHFEVCPYSSIATKGYIGELESHPLKRL